LVKVYKEKMGQYMSRAEYLKKEAMDKVVEDAPAKGGTAGAQKKKGKKDDDEDDEEKKLEG